MGKEILTFEDIEIEKNKFFNLRDLKKYIEKVLVSNNISFGEKNCKYFLVTCIMMIKLNH